MDSNLAAGLAMIGAIGPGIGLGIGFSKAMEALGRNPDAGGHHLSSGAGIRQAADVRNLSITLNSLSVFLAFTICPPVLNSRVRAARQTRQG